MVPSSWQYSSYHDAFMIKYPLPSTALFGFATGFKSTLVQCVPSTNRMTSLTCPRLGLLEQGLTSLLQSPGSLRERSMGGAGEGVGEAQVLLTSSYGPGPGAQGSFILEHVAAALLSSSHSDGHSSPGSVSPGTFLQSQSSLSHRGLQR